MSPRPLVEILSVAGCPNRERALELVHRIAAELAIEPRIELVAVLDAEAAARLRFLGSPTVRVGGKDVEPGSEDRGDYVLSCRLFAAQSGLSGLPDERWIRDALLCETRAEW
jgi:hypothetical protein